MEQRGSDRSSRKAHRRIFAARGYRRSRRACVHTPKYLGGKRRQDGWPKLRGRGYHHHLGEIKRPPPRRKRFKKGRFEGIRSIGELDLGSVAPRVDDGR